MKTLISILALVATLTVGCSSARVGSRANPAMEKQQRIEYTVPVFDYEQGGAR